MLEIEEILMLRYGLELPVPSEPDGYYSRVIRTGNLLYVCGHTPKRQGEYVFLGKVGEDFSVEQGQEAARIAMTNCLAALKEYLGDLRLIKQFVQVIGYVRSAEHFTQQPLVMNGASELLLTCFGEKGRHTRMALGTNQLPGGAAVEIMCVVEV
ncbi:putative translation initiation inhibitor, yjgF family [Desulfitobacterium dehalogenans ATCC 51507]|uniref:Putative translation initiation inhibitor, yjgF family n=1 Tax=Desulfitobacterium dehalogenans (strain ATCC 51507 / DSM 9161 / JW/IU-DC1) TaxID=756499 RepID=I4A6J2_DESDJ|nr:RidA family protein [Desulfitobacterium dehalogenans]AFL99576.1 putative translation initiation inhibitor, yjgF family [Desulfitobacterium dehalogenans ATCC 51507]